MRQFARLTALLLLASASALAEPQVYFSPYGGARDAVLRQINLSRHTIDLAIFDFTAGPVAEALADATKRGVHVRVVADRRQAAGKHSEVPYLASRQVPIRILSGTGRGIMHNKFAVIDGKTVITGSYNWTENAERHNYENLLIEDLPALALRYDKEFERLWGLAAALEPTEQQAETSDWAATFREWLKGFQRFLRIVK